MELVYEEDTGVAEGDTVIIEVTITVSSEPARCSSVGVEYRRDRVATSVFWLDAFIYRG